ncbi:MAG: hypothetical protein WD397_10685 [Wenzhouxiangellaceae bacterium]
MLATLFGATLALHTGRPAHAQQETSATASEPLSVSDVINRIHSYGRLSRENAELVLNSVDAANGPAVRLELALLLIYGPQSMQDRERGLRVLEGLVRDNDSSLIPQQTVRLIEVLKLHLGEIVALEAEHEIAMSRLEQERRARQAADEKLESLRQIEQELEAIKEQNSAGEDDGKNQQD